MSAVKYALRKLSIVEMIEEEKAKFYASTGILPSILDLTTLCEDLLRAEMLATGMIKPCASRRQVICGLLVNTIEGDEFAFKVR